MLKVIGAGAAIARSTPILTSLRAPPFAQGSRGKFDPCDPGETCAACNVAQACEGNSNCNCWLLSQDNGGTCTCQFFVQFCGQFADCPNGQSDCDSQLGPGFACVQTCCGNTCTPKCGS